MRWIPLAGVLAFFGLGFVWRAWLHRRRYGHSGIRLFRSGNAAQSAREALLVLMFGGILGQAVLAGVAPGELTGHFWFTPRASLGSVVLLVGIAIIVVAQLDMGASWQVGVDDGARPGLVQGGLYELSRNPIYVGMIVVLGGLAVLLPTTLSLVVLVGTVLGIRRQVRAEEAYLSRAYGDDYLAYTRRVARFVPGFPGPVA